MVHSNAVDGRFPGGVFTNTAGDYVWIAALPPGGLFVEHAGEALYEAAHRLIAENPPTAYHPEMRAEVAGPIATAIATRQAVERDISWVTVTCLVLVCLSIGIYFRRVRAVPLTGIPAALGAVVAFAVAELAFGYLNSSTAFLGSIIVGNGINYAIVLMSRYEEERARGAHRARRCATPWAAPGGAPPSPRWRLGRLRLPHGDELPRLLAVRRDGRVRARSPAGRRRTPSCPRCSCSLDRREGKTRPKERAPIELGALGRSAAAPCGVLVGVSSSLAAVVAAVGLRHFLQDPFEYDFRKLNAKLNTTDEAKQFGRSLDDLFGRLPSPTVILADDLSARSSSSKRASVADDEKIGGR